MLSFLGDKSQNFAQKTFVPSDEEPSAFPKGILGKATAKDPRSKKKAQLRDNTLYFYFTTKMQY